MARSQANKPNPQPLDDLLTVDNVDGYKRSDCRRYIPCLDIASTLGWQQFHCNDCSVYDPIPIDNSNFTIAEALLKGMGLE